MIAIIGAGISGLTLAYQLEKAGIPYTLLESSSSPGGYMKSSKVDNYLLEFGPVTILADNEVKEFLDELGLANEYLIPSSESKKRYVLKGGKLKKIPSGPFSLFFGNFFSWKTKKAILNEIALKSPQKEHETIKEFFDRRFSKEVTDYTISPFVSGIFAGDPGQLLMEKTFPFLLRFEKEYGSVIKGFIKNKQKGKESVIFKNGINQLIASLDKHVTSKEYGAQVVSIAEREDYLQILYRIDGKELSLLADKVVVTCPAFSAAEMLNNFYPDKVSRLKKINYAPITKVFVGFDKKTLSIQPSGYGVLNPFCEGQFSMGTLWTSSVNTSASPEDDFLFTVMVGGMNGIDNANVADDMLVKKVVDELKRVYNINSEPKFSYLYRIPKAIPQYDKNVLGLEEVVELLEIEGVYICANWYRGPSVSDCIKKAKGLSSKLSIQCEVKA